MSPRRSRSPESRSAAAARAPRRAARRPNAQFVVAAIAGAALAAAVIGLPPATLAFWGVNGFGALPIASRAAIVFASAALSALAFALARWPAAAAVVAALGIAFVAFALPEGTHFLGDSSVRLAAISTAGRGLESQSLAGWASRIHGAPLDLIVNFLVPVGLVRAGMEDAGGPSVVDFALGLLYVAGVWRLASRWAPEPILRLPLAAAMSASGWLAAFAGYSEVTALLLATLVWWWNSLLAPIRRTSDAIRIGAWWACALLAHRLALIGVVPIALRAAGRPWAGDAPTARRLLIGGSLAAAAIAIAGYAALGGGSQLSRDWAEFRSAQGAAVWISWRDFSNLMLVTAPLALLAAVGAGGAALRAGIKSWTFVLLATVALASLPIVVQVRSSGLGAYRDWDLAATLGLSLTLAGGWIISRLSKRDARRTLAVWLPGLLLLSLTWVAVHADADAPIQRARMLAAPGGGLARSQRAQVHLFLAGHHAQLREPALAAEHYEASYELAPTPNRGIIGARAWLQAGQPDSARRLILRVQARGGLDSGQTARVESVLVHCGP